MKKHLFLLSSVFAVLSLQAQVATMKVAGNTGVKVKTGTTLYVGGEMKVAQYTNANKVSNEGNVRITEKLTNENSTGNNFVNELPSTGNYGQLIINKGATNTNTGQIASTLKFKSGFNFYPISIPYANVTAENVVEDLFGAGSASLAFGGYTPGKDGWDKNRVPNNALFVWDNDEYQFTHLASGYQFGTQESDGKYYAINNTTISRTGQLNLNDNTLVKGTPLKDEVSVTLKKYNKLVNKHKRAKDASADVLDNKNIGVNDYGETYGSYIIDFASTLPSIGWTNYLSDNAVETTNFGLRIYNLGNPYTSNINIANSNQNADFWSNLEVLVQYTSQDYNVATNEAGNEVSGSYGEIIAGMTNIGAGDESLGFVAPFQTFAVKMSNSMPENVTFTFDDDMKTFNKPSASQGQLINSVFAKSSNTQRPEIKQVGLDLYDANDNFTGVKTYVVASNVYEALPVEATNGKEIYNHALTDDVTSIYTLQESENGTINEAFAKNKTYVNGVNEDKYIAKPIHLVFQNGEGQYTLKARLNKNLLNNKNSFYFEDKKDGKVIKIDENFSYTFNVNGTDKDRFVLYWAALPTEEINKEIAEESVDTTVVFRDQDVYKVRFDKEMQRADVFVYSISGQLINVDKGVNTSNDYIVPVVGNTSVYIVKIVGDNGKVVTKKIIK